MGASSPGSVATLFGELAELPIPVQADRLAALEVEHPALAVELRQLLAADAVAGDFLGALGEADRARVNARAARAPSVSEGSRVGPYRILRPLGSGGMATVWLAHDERLDRLIALKVLGNAWTGEASRGEGARARFLAEARTAASLDHPHVATVYDVGEAPDGQLFIAMAHCEGGSLADRIARGPVPRDAALRVGRELASALGAAHARGIVHRDVKPANVLFDATGRLRLADFGIATLAGQNTAHSGGGAVLGTAAYLAPEQLRGGDVDHRADLWALGVTLYETLAGSRPFTGGSYAAVLHNVLVAEPPPVDRLITVPAALGALVHQLLSKNPDERPQSAAEVSLALEAIGDGRRERSITPRSRARVSGAAAPLTSLVGREREVAITAALLERARLVTLTGPGGTGKTRIALELARRAVGQYADGAHVVLLAAVSSPDQVAVAVGESLGLRALGDISAAEHVARQLASSESLLVLDNFEQVLDAAPFVAALLEAAPRLTILVTSRAPLRLRGEQELPVPPLALPAAEDGTSHRVGEAAAVQLFVERARAVRPDFMLDDDNALSVATLCRRLDGLPLAIELAAARVKLLSPRALLARLAHPLEVLRSNARDAEPRHRTMHAVIDWSYELLAPRERALFRRLSVFVGGFTIESIAAMARAMANTDDADAHTPLELATSLHDNSLLQRTEQSDGEPRFDLLETVREYALHRLHEAGELEAARATHRAYCLALAESAAPHLRGPEQVAWLGRLERDDDNLRAALDDAIAVDDLESATRLGVALHRYWLVSRRFLGVTVERLETIDARLRARQGDVVPPGAHAALLTAIGLLAGVRDAPADVAFRWFDGALQLYRRAGDADAVATTQNHLAWSAQLLGEYDRASALARDALLHHAGTGNLLGEAIARSNLGWVALMRGELSDATHHLERALAIHRERADPRACSYALNFLGSVELERGDCARAIQLHEEAMAIGEPVADRVFPTGRARWVLANHLALRPVDGIALLRTEIVPRLREVGHAFSTGLALACLGRLLCDDGQLAEARAALEESLAVRRGSRHPSMIAHSEALLAEVALLAGDRAASAAFWRASLERRMEMGEPLSVVECLEGISRLALEQGDARAATRLHAGASAQRARYGSALPPRARSGDEAHDHACERALGTEAFAREREWSRGASLEELASLALGVVGAR
ncbi:MAG TPA: protein kinase [Gemmatimonadaceae bacterium]